MLRVIWLNFAITFALFTSAYFKNKQFYPAVVYITRSSANMFVIYTQVLLLIWIVGKLLKNIFFGELRHMEMEHLTKRLWPYFLDVCISMTAFEDNFSVKFVLTFTLLFFIKAFHLMVEGRIDIMEMMPVVPRYFHVKIVSMLCLLNCIDSYFIYTTYSFNDTGVPVEDLLKFRMVFFMEFTILLILNIYSTIKYCLQYYSSLCETPWKSKDTVFRLVELAMKFIKLNVYIIFIIVNNSPTPFYIFAKPLFIAMRDFQRAYIAFTLSRQAIKNMQSLCPNATAEELQGADNICIICREEMTDVTTAKKLPCKHIFHAACLQSWFQRKQNCPTCRYNMLKIPNINQQNGNEDLIQQAWNSFMESIPKSAPPLPSSLIQSISSSIENLKSIEGDERANIEARIYNLKHIQKLLNHAAIMMHYYHWMVFRNSISAVTNQETTVDGGNMPPSFYTAANVCNVVDNAGQNYEVDMTENIIMAGGDGDQIREIEVVDHGEEEQDVA